MSKRIQPRSRTGVIGDRSRRCPVDFNLVPEGRGVETWYDVFCGQSCYVAWRERFGPGGVAHAVPDPRFHRAGDGWRHVKRWTRAVVAVATPHRRHPRRDRRGQSKPR